MEIFILDNNNCSVNIFFSLSRLVFYNSGYPRLMQPAKIISRCCKAKTITSIERFTQLCNLAQLRFFAVHRLYFYAGMYEAIVSMCR